MFGGYIALHLGKKYALPIVYTYHTRYEQYLHYLFSFADVEYENVVKNQLTKGATNVIRSAVTLHNRVFTNRCDLVFAPTALMQEFLRENGTWKEIAILPTGLSDDDFIWNDENVLQIKNTYSPNGERLFLCVARLEKEKNLGFLISAMKKYKDMYNQNFKLLIAGEGSYRSELQDMTVELGLENHIVFAGNIPHDRIVDYCKASALFLFASKSETQGIVLLEAMAAGTPVIAVQASGVDDVVIDSVNGFAVSENETVFTETINKVIGDNELFSKLQKGALDTALKYTSDSMAERAEIHYQALLSCEKGITSEPYCLERAL